MTLLSSVLHRIPYLRAIIAQRDYLLRHSTPLGTIRCNGDVRYDSIDESPWQHPFLTAHSIGRFRRYSEAVHEFAISRYKGIPCQISCAFSVNMAQNMYKWGQLAQKYGVRATLFCHPWDVTAVSSPEWEEFDGEYNDLLDGTGFHEQHPDIKTVIPVRRPEMDGGDLFRQWKLVAKETERSC